jgi:hypothetical protein
MGCRIKHKLRCSRYGGGGGIRHSSYSIPEAEFMNMNMNTKLSFLSINFRVIRLEISIYNVYITNQFQTTFAQGGRESKSVSRGDCE